MVDCWKEDHTKRPTFAMIKQRIEEILESDRLEMMQSLCVTLCIYSLAGQPLHKRGRVWCHAYTRLVLAVTQHYVTSR